VRSIDPRSVLAGASRSGLIPRISPASAISSERTETPKSDSAARQRRERRGHAAGVRRCGTSASHTRHLERGTFMTRHNAP
jgi:hypothetical protein